MINLRFLQYLIENYCIYILYVIFHVYITKSHYNFFLKIGQKSKLRIFANMVRVMAKVFTNASMSRNHNFLLIKNIGIWHNPYQNQYDQIRLSIFHNKKMNMTSNH
jgi:hypothetical protein